MGRKATNSITFNELAIRRVVKEAMEAEAEREFRFDGMPGLVLSVYRGGGAAWRYFYVNSRGQRRKYRLGDYATMSLGEARIAYNEAFKLVDAGKDPVGEALDRKTSETFRQLAEAFLESGKLADSTRIAYEFALKSAVYPVIGDLPAVAVTENDVFAIIRKIEAGGAKTHADRVKSMIGGVYRWASQQRRVPLKFSPARGIEKRAEASKRTRTPTSEEIAELWATLESDDAAGKLSKQMRLLIKLVVLTGQRRSEIAGARLAEFDGEFTRWVIPGDETRRGKLIQGRTKNGLTQVVPLSRQAADLWREAIALGEPGREYVFPADLSKLKVGATPRLPHIHGESVTKALVRLRGEADYSIHDMRRAVSSWLKTNGFSRDVRDAVLNHKDPSVTGAHYDVGADMERQVRVALQAWADHVWAVTGKAEPRETARVVALRA